MENYHASRRTKIYPRGTPTPPAFLSFQEYISSIVGTNRRIATVAFSHSFSSFLPSLKRENGMISLDPAYFDFPLYWIRFILEGDILLCLCTTSRRKIASVEASCKKAVSMCIWHRPFPICSPNLILLYVDMQARRGDWIFPTCSLP